MKNFLKITGFIFAGLLICLYLAYLFVLPKSINLNTYKGEIQKLVLENTGLNVDFGRVDVITSPWLEAGIKTDNVKVMLPDNSVLFSADAFKGKVFLPSLLWLSVRVTCAEVESPFLNVEIMNSNKFKVAKVYEDLVNKRREQNRLNPPKNNEVELPFDPSKIKVFVPALTLNNYKAVIDDIKAGHNLTLKGEQLKVGYFNNKFAKLKTQAQILSDENKNITADLDIKTFIPEFAPAESERVDNEAIFELPFVNPVTTYRDYDLKSNISSKMKIRKSKKDGKIKMNGFAYIENTTVKLSGLQLPESHFRLKAKGTTAEIDTNVFVTDSEFLKLFGTIDYGKNPYVDLKLKSSQVHFSNLLKITKAYLDTVHIQNELGNISANGYLMSNAELKTDFKDIISTGKIIVRDGYISDKNIGLLVNKIHANLLFDNNTFQIKDTHILVNDRPIDITGKIDSHSIANFTIDGNKIPLRGLYNAFAPRDIKSLYSLNSGLLTLNAKVVGEIKDISAMAKADLENLSVSDKAGNFSLKNDFAHFGIANYSGIIRGRIKNSGFNFTLPKTGAVIKDDLLVVNIDNDDVVINDSFVKINKLSEVKFNGEIKKYLTRPDTHVYADGNLASSDLGIFAGKESIPYFAIKGFIPVKAKFDAKGKKMKLIVQAKANENNYITPVKIHNLSGKQSLFQFILRKNGDTLKITNSGLYTRKMGSKFDDNLYSNLSGAKEIVGARAIVSNLSTKPFINLFKVNIPNDLDASICIFDKSKFTLGGNLFVFGNIDSPKINGRFDIRNLKIPEIYTSMRQGLINLEGQDINVSLNDINANDSDFNVQIKSNLNLIQKMTLSDVRVTSRLIDVDKIMKVSEALTKSLPVSSGSSSSAPADIPVTIRNGSINLSKIVTGAIVATNTTGRISLYKNIFYLNRLKTYTMEGSVGGDVSMNLVSTQLNAKLKGKDFNVEKMLLDVMQMKDTLSGTMNFLADISLKGTTMQEQMKTLKGFVDFNIKEGQLGPFGKFENFLMAENIRENQFFSSTIGSVITNLVTIDTSHFNSLFGHLTFEDGFADISPIKSQGDVMSIYIAGKLNLLDNTADMKLRGKLASAFSDKLGPLSNINPINLVKHTPGLNIVAVKAFAFFCEAVSEEEMNALPPLGKGKSDENATKFQIVLRGDTAKPLKMIKSFKWLALDSEIESAKNFVDTLPTPAEGEENMSVEELIQLRAQQAQAAQQGKTLEQLNKQNEKKSVIDKIKDFFNK